MKRVILSALAAGIFATAAAQEELTLRKCLEIGLENNYDIRIVRNEERISDNNATAANAGMVPTIDFEAGYSGALDNERTTPREGDAWSDNGIYDQTFNAGINLNWTIFDGFRIRTNYKKLKEMQEMGTVRTRITIEDFVASLTAEYYNYVQQTLRLQNFRYAVALSRERLRITEARVSVGNFSRLDLLQARVDFNADSSKYMSQQELVSASRIRINELLANKDVNEMLCIRDSVIEVNGELKWEELLAQTLDTNASLLLAGHDNVLAELDLKTVQARNYPYLNLTTGYGYTYNRFGNGTTRSRGTLGLNAGVKLGSNGAEHGGLHLHEAHIVQIPAQIRHELAADLKVPLGFGIHNEIHIPLAVAQLLVRQTVELLRQGLEGLRQQGDLMGPDAHLALLGAEHVALDAYDITDVIFPEAVIGLLVHLVLPGVDLDAAGLVLQIAEGHLAHAPLAHKTARQRDGLPLQLVELVLDLLCVMGHVIAGDLEGVFDWMNHETGKSRKLNDDSLWVGDPTNATRIELTDRGTCRAASLSRRIWRISRRSC